MPLLSDKLVDSSAAPKRPRRACKFKQCDVTRAVRAVTKAGLEIASVKITSDGSIIISARGASEPTNDLDRELAEFEVRKFGTRQ
jgi:hypothetical protein